MGQGSVGMAHLHTRARQSFLNATPLRLDDGRDPLRKGPQPRHGCDVFPHGGVMDDRGIALGAEGEGSWGGCTEGPTLALQLPIIAGQVPADG